MILIARILLLIFALTFASCGNKTPLRLPDNVLETDLSYERS